MMPKKVANKNAGNNPNCVGDNVSPQLSWTGVPAGTKSFALLMEDPEGRGGAGVHHWVAYGIPANVTSFAEGEVSKEVGQVCRRQEHPGRRQLLRPVHPARHAAPLHLRHRRDRSRPEGIAAGPDPRRVAGQDRAAGRPLPRERLGRPCRPVREAGITHRARLPHRGGIDRKVVIAGLVPAIAFRVGGFQPLGISQVDEIFNAAGARRSVCDLAMSYLIPFYDNGPCAGRFERISLPGTGVSPWRPPSHF